MKSKVYFTKNITPESLIKIYEKLNVNLTGNIGVKVSTGEKGSKWYLKSELIKPLVDKLISKFNEKTLNIISAIIVITLIVDCIYSFIIK